MCQEQKKQKEKQNENLTKKKRADKIQKNAFKKKRNKRIRMIKSLLRKKPKYLPKRFWEFLIPKIIKN